ncbi:hypothetical protein D5018_16905 [Parashewanella curva]|uniref:Uncharacterized protein n=2 Tax=Parashewanella curva TaxID=2338552 RepID=A0A3L8PWW5_9GAMM|nr:hypothetical protein D5018_16905 [Parashewanella curva]
MNLSSLGMKKALPQLKIAGRFYKVQKSSDGTFSVAIQPSWFCKAQHKLNDCLMPCFPLFNDGRKDLSSEIAKCFNDKNFYKRLLDVEEQYLDRHKLIDHNTRYELEGEHLHYVVDDSLLMNSQLWKKGKADFSLLSKVFRTDSSKKTKVEEAHNCMWFVLHIRYSPKPVISESERSSERKFLY